jgi:hypothetical protein
MIDSISHWHNGTQQMIVKDNNGFDLLTIHLYLYGCIINFRHRLPTASEIALLKKHYFIQEDSPWNPSSFSHQIADKLYHQVIDTENYNSSSKNLPNASIVEVHQKIQSCLYMTHQTYLRLKFNKPILIIQFLPTLMLTIA